MQYFEIQQVNQYAQEKKTLAIEIKITKKPIDPALTPILLVQRRELPVLNFSGGLPSTKGSYATDNYGRFLELFQFSCNLLSLSICQQKRLLFCGIEPH